MEIEKELKDALGSKLVEHKGLKDYTTMKVGGVADYAFEAENIEELIGAVQAAVDVDVPYFVLGGGSNVIISDYGYPGLVIVNRSSNIGFLKEKTQVIVDSGVYLAHLITKAAAIEFGGLEFLIGVPGTIGGAIYNNVSCWGGVIGDYVRGVTLLMPGEQKGERSRTINIDADEMKFGYHSCWIKQVASGQAGRKPVILSVKFQLTSLRREEIMRRIKEYQELRLSRQPIGEYCAGSIFRNPSGAEASAAGEDEKKYSAGYLIDQAGGKKMRVGGAQVSKKHANFIVHNGKATAEELRELINQVKGAVSEKKGITLEEEIEYVGKWPEEK